MVLLLCQISTRTSEITSQIIVARLLKHHTHNKLQHNSTNNNTDHKYEVDHIHFERIQLLVAAPLLGTNPLRITDDLTRE